MVEKYSYIINRINARLYAVRSLQKANNIIMAQTMQNSPAHKKATQDLHDCLIIETELLKLKAKPNEK